MFPVRTPQSRVGCTYVSMIHMTARTLARARVIATLSYVLSERDINTYTLSVMYIMSQKHHGKRLNYFLLEYASKCTVVYTHVATLMIHQNNVPAFTVLTERGFRDNLYIEIALHSKRLRILEIALSTATTLDDNVIQFVVHKGMTVCVNSLANSLDRAHLITLLGYAIGYDRLDYVRVILDAGGVTVNDHPRHFLHAVKKRKYDIVEEFIHRGVHYENDFIHIHTKRDYRMYDLLMSNCRPSCE